MKIFLGWTGTKKAGVIAEKYNCGWQISPSNYRMQSVKKEFIIDNDCFTSYLNKKPWNEKRFYTYLKRFDDLDPFFRVVPDRVAAGYESLLFSLDHVENIKRPRALAVQDGMTSQDVRKYIQLFDFIFVGGTVKWKISTMQMWCDVAHLHGLRCHVGRIGTFQGYSLCQSCGVDSVDGTNPSRHSDERPLMMFYEQKKFNDFEWMDV